MPVNIKNCAVSLTNAAGVVIIPAGAGTVPNANMQFESGPTQNPDFAQDGIIDGRNLFSVRVNNPASATWPSPGDVLTVLAFPGESYQVGDWEIIRTEPGGFRTLLLFVKSLI